MLRAKKQNRQGKKSRRIRVDGEVCLDNSSVVIDRMTELKRLLTANDATNNSSSVFSPQTELNYYVCDPGHGDCRCSGNRFTLTVSVTVGAACQYVLPAWFAITEHVPLPLVMV